MEIQDEKEHEHARLVLLVAEDEPVKGVWPFTNFAVQMRKEFPGMGPMRLKGLYTAYCGWDDRETPWLSVETGERL